MRALLALPLQLRSTKTCSKIEMPFYPEHEVVISALKGQTGDAISHTVAIQGESGAFSHEAALALAPGAKLLPCALSAEVFACLADGSADAAVIPIENSLAGSVLEHYDLLLAHPVQIEGEYLLRIRHNLIAPHGTSIEQLRAVYSHPIALAQCKAFFAAHTHLRPTSFYDTAGSVKHVVAEGDRSIGAIASRQAAQEHGGVILAEGIEDNAENYTRFFLIRRAGLPALQTPAVPANKVSLCFAVANRPGSLVHALQVFADQQINLTRIESRPVPGSPWEYIFYADYQLARPGDADAALNELREHCSMLRELGRYRAGKAR